MKISKKYSNAFFKLFIGLLSSVTFYSLVKTSAISINIGFLFLSILFVITTQQKIDFTDYKKRFKLTKEELNAFASILVFSSVIFFWKYYCLFNNNQAYPIVINSDSIFHSNIAIFLNTFGIESLNTNYFYPPNGVHPYHYFEGWTIAFFSFLFKLNYWIAEECIVYPVFAAIIITGTWSLIEKFIRLTNLTKFWGLLTLFFTGFFFEGLTELSSIFNLKETYSFNYNAIDEFWALKLAVAYIFAIAGINLLIDDKKLPAVIVLLGLPVATITLAPGILGATSLFILFIFIFRKKLKTISPIGLITILIPIGVFIFIALFYKLTGSSEEYITTPSKEELLNEINSITSIKNKIILFIFRIIQIILFYSPVWIISLITFFTVKDISKNHFQKLKSTLLFTSFLVIFSLTIWLLLFFGFGSKAYFFYATLPFLNIISVTILIVSQRTLTSPFIKWGVRCFMVVILGVFCFRTFSIYSENKKDLWDKYSQHYISEAYTMSKSIKNRMGGRLEGGDYFNNPIVIDNVDHFGSFLSGFGKNSDENFVVTSLSSIDITKNQLDNTLNKNYILTSPLYQFTTQLKVDKKFTTNEDARFEFLVKNHIEYLIVNKDILLEKSIKLVVKKQLTDPKTGIQLVLLDQSKMISKTQH